MIPVTVVLYGKVGPVEIGPLDRIRRRYFRDSGWALSLNTARFVADCMYSQLPLPDVRSVPYIVPRIVPPTLATLQYYAHHSKSWP